MLINQEISTIYHFKPIAIDGKVTDLSSYKGKKILIVNTASECGNTPQYADLEKLFEENKEHLVILGFPANNFGEQEPGTNAQIASFCKKNYGVTFPIMSKLSVKGDDIDPLFKWLIEQPNPDFTGNIKWNFEKFLIDENGKLIRRFPAKLSPSDDQIKKAIQNN
jgi:glutathione peroxidase